jgi:hypothetical protein
VPSTHLPRGSLLALKRRPTAAILHRLLQMSNDPEFVAENLLALVLIALAVVAAANIALKLLIVTYGLAAAGLRYTVVGILVAILLTQVQPGRWWL